MPGLAYDVLATLTVPESEYNVLAGNFMLHGSLLNNELVLAANARPLILEYRSPLYRAIHTLFWSAPMLAGFARQSQTLKSRVFDGHVESLAAPLTSMRLEIDNPGLQIYSASVSFGARFTGLRYLMYYWFFSTAFVVCGLLFLAQSVASLIVYRISYPYIFLALGWLVQAPPAPAVESVTAKSESEMATSTEESIFAEEFAGVNGYADENAHEINGTSDIYFANADNLADIDVDDAFQECQDAVKGHGRSTHTESDQECPTESALSGLSNGSR